MDAFDKAQALEERERSAILDKKRQETETQGRFTYAQCIACGEPIPAQRQEYVPGVKRCVSCQEEYELDKKRGL